MKRINTLLYLCLSIGLFSCKKNNPLDTEQYKKEVFIVGATQSTNQGLLIKGLPYLAGVNDEVPTYISVAVGGSQETDRDVKVSIEEAGTSVIDHYNFLYLYSATDVKYQYLANSFYRIPEKMVTIKKGETYARVPIFVKTANLHPDSLYALTFKVSSVSEPGLVSVRKADSVLIFSFSMMNSYSGAYQLQGTTTKEGSTNLADQGAVSGSRTLKAVNVNTVRLIHLSSGENLANAGLIGVSIQVNTDNTLQVKPWGAFALLSGGGNYNPANKTFDIWYTWKEGTITYRFAGKYVKSDV